MKIIEIDSGYIPNRGGICLENINRQILELEKKHKVTVINLVKKQGYSSTLDYVYEAFLVLEDLEANTKTFIN